MATSTPKENPYLAHLHPSQRGQAHSPSPSSSNGAAASKEPLYGFLPRKVTGAQVRKAMVRCSSLGKGKRKLSWNLNG